MPNSQNIFRTFKKDITAIELPQFFTYPFYYEPHHLTKIAAEELQEELCNNEYIKPLFDPKSKSCLPVGKMFGVLIVETPNQEIGYLAAFSGKLGNHTHLAGFVPPIFDLWHEDSFFVKREIYLNAINTDIKTKEENEDFINLKLRLEQEQEMANQAIAFQKEINKKNKQERKSLRQKQETILDTEDFLALNDDLIKQSLRDKHELRVITSQWQEKITHTQKAIEVFQQQITTLKKERKEKSNALQQDLFQNYRFLNYLGEEQDLLDIFEKTNLKQPPAAAGDCAAPKLLQYAYNQQLKPIALGEFWWGESPKSEIRKHLHFYPACRGKCEPILGHMLQGLMIEDNPLLNSQELQQPLEIIYEDEVMLVINKPTDFLSVPGIHIQDSVYERIKLQYPTITGPIIVHRLDMATSGLLVLAKNKQAHKALQSQFIKKTIQKRYVALLDGTIEAKEGHINLPLRVDLDDRPRQMVCYAHGKPAKTKWERIKVQDGKTKVYFYPITGRTHQLRMHAAHIDGLNTPIMGDDLYGTKSDRLYLHAEQLTLRHPETLEVMVFQAKEDF